MGAGQVAAVWAAVWMFAMAALAGDAAAQGTARSLDLDTSVRSLGRGGASAAVFWDGGNEWVNPALLGYRNGLSCTWDRHELVPDLPDGIVLSSRRVSLGLLGVGFSTAGQPVDVMGGTDLDYGTMTMTDPNGQPLMAPHSFEHIRAWSLGVSLASVLDHAATALGRSSGFADWADVAVGASRKRVAVAFYSPETFSANASDLGLLVRVSPLDTRRWAGGDEGVTHRLDLAYGHAVINANDATLDFGLGGPVPLSRLKREGGAVGWTMRPAPADLRANALLRRIAGPDRALLRVVAAHDREHVSAGDDETDSYDVDRWGVEAAFGRVAAVRTGHVRDEEGDVDGYSWGFGLGAPLGPLAEVAYDFSSAPQAPGQGRRPAHAVTLRLDVLGTLDSWRKEGARAEAN